jgi:uncharacterized protein YjiS (DUF1127 family)
MNASLRLSSSTSARPVGRAPKPWTGLVGTLEQWVERRRQRRALLELNEHMLKDIGVSAADAWQESQKPFWRQ